MGTGKQYDEEFKKQAILLAKEVGAAAAAKELSIHKGTLGTWVHRSKAGGIDTGAGTRTPEEVGEEERLKSVIKSLSADLQRLTVKADFALISAVSGLQSYCLERKNLPWKYQALAEEMMKIHNEDKYNDRYGRGRMYMALKQKSESGETDVHIPSKATVRNVMSQIGLIHEPRRKPNGITKADREARKSDDLLKRNFSADKPLEKAVTDISELNAKDGKGYVSAIFDCFVLCRWGLPLRII